MEPEQRPCDATIIVVSFNTRALTLECLASIYRESTALSFEVIVVDNASSDGSAAAIAESFPDLALHALERNLGFGAANNLAAADARGEFLVLLNPDTRVTDDAVGAIVRHARSLPAPGIIGGRTLFADGTLNPTSCWGAPGLWSTFCRAACLSSLFPRSALFDPTSLGRWQRDTEREVGVVSGCFLLIPRALWRRLDGFDEAFFMYGEDVDLALRAKQLGFGSRITPTATVVHVGAASERVRADKLMRLMGAHRRIMRKHWSRPRAALGLRLHAAGVLARVVGARLLRRLPRAGRFSGAAVWIEVWRRRSEWR